MKLGVMAALFAGMKLDDALVYCAELGLWVSGRPWGVLPVQPFFDTWMGLASPK